MQFATLRKFALSLPEVTEEPHHNFGSFRVRSKIFVTVPPGAEHVHVFVSEQQREQALAVYPHFAARLIWGGKVVGLRVHLPTAEPTAVKRLVHQAWQHKAPKALLGGNAQP
jgi:hypothetical protein